MKSIEEDVQQLKGALKLLLSKDNVANWQTATTARRTTPWTNSQNQRGAAPWEEIETAMTRRGNDAVGAFIARTVRKMTASYYTFRP
jgi:hypothetical protein